MIQTADVSYLSFMLQSTPVFLRLATLMELCDSSDISL